MMFVPARERLLRRRGFSLVEIIVAIAIVALLISLLVPVISGAGRRALSMQCQSNLRQLFAMAETYSLRSNGRYPVAVRYEREAGEPFTTIAWDFEQSRAHVDLGPLWKHVAEPGKVQQCPECDACASTFGNDPYTGYNYNTTFIAGEARFPSLGWSSVRPGLPRSQWRRTDTTALFGDGGWRGGANKFMRAPLNTVERDLQVVYAGGQAFRHGGTTNVAWLDGHVSAVADPRPGEFATENLLRDVMNYRANGFLSDDDSAYDPR
ncbi:MAG: prepilin-type N-terminal cleavage/methylation domain-containing protein [Phycisphaerales bacterium]